MSFRKRFETTDDKVKWGDLTSFLGMRCEYKRAEGELTLDVEHKIRDMLKRFPELAKLPYKSVPLQPVVANKECARSAK